jgi:predicted metal-dependent peptidase
MLYYPFWCELYYTMKIIETLRVPTLATDGRNMFVNPKFWDTLTLDYRVSALAHEVCHKMLHHCTRGRGHDPYWANIAMDIVVNTLLAANGFKIHKNWVQPDQKYAGWTYEAVYHDITKDLQQPPPQPQGGEGTTPPPQEDDGDEKQPGGGAREEGEDGDEEGQEGKGSPQEESSDGEGEGEGDPEGEGDGGTGYCDRSDIPKKYQGAWKDVKQYIGTPEQVEAFEEKIEQQVQQAIAAAKAMGHAPAGIEAAVVKATRVAEEKWFDHLQRYFQSMRQAEYDWARINRRYAAIHRVVAPVQYTERLGKVVIFVDASGSCWDKMIQSCFASHINAILAEAQPEETHVAYFDTIVHKHVIVDPGNIEFEEAPSGGGGTSIRWMAEWLESEGIEPAVVIVLTDMYIDFPVVEPPCPVIWASITPKLEAPFGETIHVK